MCHEAEDLKIERRKLIKKLSKKKYTKKTTKNNSKTINKTKKSKKNKSDAVIKQELPLTNNLFDDLPMHVLEKAIVEAFKDNELNEYLNQNEENLSNNSSKFIFKKTLRSGFYKNS